MGRQHQEMDRPGVRQVPEGGGEQGKNGENWFQNHLWCTNDPRGEGIDDNDEEEITYLRFVINSRDVAVKLTYERPQKVLQACDDLLRQTRSKIRSVASCVGLMVSSFAGVPLGQLHYRS